MKPPSKGRKVEKEVWQVDSSSWEFLGIQHFPWIHLVIRMVLGMAIMVLGMAFMVLDMDITVVFEITSL
jgi:hypothetical protein